MRADSFSRQADRDGEGSVPAVHAGLAALLIGLAGCFGTFQVWVLALAGAMVSYSIARRDGSEPATVDRTATFLRLAFLLVLCAAAFDNRVQRIDILDPSATGLAGFALIAAGLYLRQRAVAALGSDFTIKVVVRAGHRLIEGGPYRTVRHPNYAGLVLVMLGTAMGLQSPLALAAVIFLWLPALLLRIRAEEVALGQQLGEEYLRYVQRTWRLVPGLY